MTTKRVVEAMANFKRHAGGLPESRSHIIEWLATFTPPLLVEEQLEMIRLLEQETKTMNDFGQHFADAYLQWSQKVRPIEAPKPRQKRRSAILRIDEQTGKRRKCYEVEATIDSQVPL